MLLLFVACFAHRVPANTNTWWCGEPLKKNSFKREQRAASSVSIMSLKRHKRLSSKKKSMFPFCSSVLFVWGLCIIIMRFILNIVFHTYNTWTCCGYCVAILKVSEWAQSPKKCLCSTKTFFCNYTTELSHVSFADMMSGPPWKLDLNLIEIFTWLNKGLVSLYFDWKMANGCNDLLKNMHTYMEKQHIR